MVPGGIAGEKRHVEAAVDQRLTQRAHVFGVVAVGVVFVFDLDHEERAAVGDLLRSENAADFEEKFTGGFEETRVGCAKSDFFLVEEPPRQAAHFPFGAGIRARPQQHPEAIFSRCSQYSRGTRAKWISPQRIWKCFPSSKNSFSPMANVCGGVVSAAESIGAPM